MGASNRMPIGRFARCCRLSVKALRHYDELGLLAPAWVDPVSGYRYYDRTQARAAVMIGMLRSLDLPLAVIRRALDANPGDLKALIDTETARIETEVAARERALLSLRCIAESGTLAPARAEITDEPPRNIARLRGTTDADRLVPDTTELVYALLEEVRESSLEIGSVFALNDFGDGEGPIAVDVCVEVEGQGSGPQRAERVQLPGGRFAGLRHVGPYETLGLAHHALWAWLQENGHEADGPIWEFYVNDPLEVQADALITDVRIPVSD